MIKNLVLQDLKRLVEENKFQIILHNQKDLENAANLDEVLLDRLKVDDNKVNSMIKSIHDVIEIPDPEGKLLYTFTHENGMVVENKVVPFGRVLIIYESRPDVTIEAAISAFKAGNSILLKGGKEAKNTNLFLVQLWHEALKKNGLTTDLVTYLNIDRHETQELIRSNRQKVDLIIPRGGESLINYVRSNTAIPIIVSGRGNNFAYVHKDADLKIAIDIVLDGKKRLSVCNALDKVLFHHELPWLEEGVTQLIKMFNENGISVYSNHPALSRHPLVLQAEGEDILYEEFLGPRILFDQVENLDSAIEKINTYSGGHSATIITEDESTALNFQVNVDCAAVMHNASTRFTDGGQFGFGAEIAISTQKLHFRGPVSLSQLVTNKWFVSGSGQTRS